MRKFLAKKINCSVVFFGVSVDYKKDEKLM
jgi:hypothetical protein